MDEENNTPDDEENNTPDKVTTTDIVLPFDPSSIGSFTELQVITDKGINRRQRLLTIIEEAVAKEWNELRSFLVQADNPAGSAQYAHAMFANHVFVAYDEDFKKVGEITGRLVTRKEIWGLSLGSLKNRGFVFEGGYVTGIRTKSEVE